MWTICFGIYLALALPLASWFILALKGAKRVDHARFGDEEFKPSYARFPLKTTAEIASPVSSAEHL